MKQSGGYHVVEGCIALFVLTGMVLTTLCTLDVVRKSFILSDGATEALNETRSQAVHLLWGQMLLTDSEALKKATTAAADSIETILKNWDRGYFIEVRAFEVSVITPYISWAGFRSVPNTTSTRGSLVLPVSVEKRTDLSKKLQGVEATFREKGGLELFSGRTALYQGKSTTHHRGGVVILAARAVLSLGDGATGRWWKTITGDSYLTTTKVSILRGDMA